MPNQPPQIVRGSSVSRWSVQLAGAVAWAVLLGGLGAGSAQAQVNTDPEQQPPAKSPRADLTQNAKSERALSREVAASLTALLDNGLRASDRPTRTTVMVGLARLRDPLLQPLFSILGTTGPADDRADAIIALAASDARRGLDPLLLRHLTTDAQLLTVLRETLSRGIVSIDQLTEVSRWPDLSDRVHIEIAAHLAGLPAAKQPILNRQRLRTAAQGGELTKSVTAAAVLAQLGDPLGLSVLARRTPELLAPEGRPALHELLALVGSAALTSLEPWAMVLISPGATLKLDNDLREQIIIAASGAKAAAFITDAAEPIAAAADPTPTAPPSGAGAEGAKSPAAASTTVSAAPTKQDSTDHQRKAAASASARGPLRSAILQIATDALDQPLDSWPVWILDALNTDPRSFADERWKQLAGKARTGGQREVLLLIDAITSGSADADAAALSLIETIDQNTVGGGPDNGRSSTVWAARVCRWAVDWSSHRPFHESVKLRQAVVRALARSDAAPLFDAASRAASQLAEQDSDALLELVTLSGPGVFRARLAVMVGALTSQRAEAAVVAEPIALAQSDGRLDSMATLVLARHGKARPEAAAGAPGETARRLAGLALGDEVRQVTVRSQAAWLALRTDGQDQQALARLLSPPKPRQPGATTPPASEPVKGR